MVRLSLIRRSIHPCATLTFVFLPGTSSRGVGQVVHGELRYRKNGRQGFRLCVGTLGPESTVPRSVSRACFRLLRARW